MWLEALRMVYDEIENGENTHLFREVVSKIDGRLGPDYGRIMLAWSDAVDRQAELRKEKLENELNAYRVAKGMAFVGGESAALSRVHGYFWKKDLFRIYKVTRNGMLGPDYSTKFSPWLASGSLSPCFIYEEVRREKISERMK